MVGKPLKGALFVVCRKCKREIHSRNDKCPHCEALTPLGEAKACRFEGLEKLAKW